MGHFDLKRTEEATRELFGGSIDQRPDAVFIANDYMAVRAMDIMRFELGIRIPHDVSVIGFDDTVMAALPTYDLTTMRQPVNRMVDAALRVLFDRIENRTDEPAHVLLGAQLIKQGTVRERT